MKTMLLRTLLSKSSKSHSTAGFSLMELFAVLAIIGILATIAGPSWLAFLNGRRAADSASQLLDTLRLTQSEASKTRRAHTLELNPGNADPAILRYGTVSSAPAARTTTVLGGSEAKQGLIDIRGIDNNGTAVTELRFTGQGNLDTEFLRSSNYNLPIYLTVIVPSPDAQPTARGKKRCVIVETLLGATRDGRDDVCKS
jgi:prepilin-type N-terminal cleavage/methylation domain-containing protein